LWEQLDGDLIQALPRQFKGNPALLGNLLFH
jgi:hypothetical protein